MPEPRPPGLTRRVLTALLPAEPGLAIRRDLDEAFDGWVAPRRGARAARAWYRRKAWASIAHVWWDTARRAFGKGGDVDGVMQDLKWAVRCALRRPGFTAIAAATLGLGIGAATAVYSVVDQVLLRPLDLPTPDRLVAIWSLEDGEIGNSSAPNLSDLEAGVSAFEDAYLFSRGEVVLERPDGTRRVLPALTASAGVLRTLGVAPALGRDLLEADEPEGAAPVALLSHARWRSDFGGDPGVLGRQVVVDGVSREVVGVLPADLDIPMADGVDVVTPLTRTGLALARDLVWLGAIARMAPGATLAATRAEAEGVWEGLRAEYPDAVRDSRVAVLPLQSYLVSDVRPALLALLAATGVLLSMACVNVGGLLLARGRAREAELAVRASLGARRGRLLRQLLTEGAILTSLAAIFGIGLGALGLRALLALAPPELTQLARVGLDPRILAACIVASIAVGVGTTLLPGLAATRRDPARHFAARGGVRGLERGRGGLVVVQVAAATVLCTGAGLLGRSLATLTSVDPGYRIDGIVTAQVRLPDDGALAREELSSLYARLEDEVRALPDVADAGFTLMRPLSDARIHYDIAVDGAPPSPAAEARSADLQLASGGHFRALDIPVVEGRLFGDTEGRADPRVALVSRSLAEALWPDESALGHRIRWVADPRAEPIWSEIVGVVADVHQQSPMEPRHGTLYVSLLQLPQWSGTLTVRVRGEVAPVAEALRDVVGRLAPGAPEPDIVTLREAMRTTLSASRLNAALFFLFASIALVLAAMGVYGLLSFNVVSRRAEIGLRMALGATRAATLSSVAGRGMAYLGLGTTLGLAAALGFAGLLRGLLYEVAPRDPATFVGVAVTLTLVGAIAAALPSWRASRLDPARTLRGDG